MKERKGKKSMIWDRFFRNVFKYMFFVCFAKRSMQLLVPQSKRHQRPFCSEFPKQTRTLLFPITFLSLLDLGVLNSTSLFR